mmetsp:Transcript_43483/g.80926  ORF Transcript_43483/g.80926 Transcript_43483/m.80926 type:complete len:143 (+) Transcript_43483:336-764(+)
MLCQSTKYTCLAQRSNACRRQFKKSNESVSNGHHLDYVILCRSRQSRSTRVMMMGWAHSFFWLADFTSLNQLVAVEKKSLRTPLNDVIHPTGTTLISSQGKRLRDWSIAKLAETWHCTVSHRYQGLSFFFIQPWTLPPVSTK